MNSKNSIFQFQGKQEKTKKSTIVIETNLIRYKINYDSADPTYKRRKIKLNKLDREKKSFFQKKHLTRDRTP